MRLQHAIFVRFVRYNRAIVVDARFLGGIAYVLLLAAVFDQLICVRREFVLSDILLGGNEAYAIQKG